jgi:hypothetical protein
MKTAAVVGDLDEVKRLFAAGVSFGTAADWTAKNGHLETLQWIRANGGGWTEDAADWAAGNGHLETLEWIRANGGGWTYEAADRAAQNGHLETLKWIRANGGEWTDCAAEWAARNGHLETLKWIRANGGEWTTRDADWAAGNGHLKTLQWIRANGGGWSRWAADWAALEWKATSRPSSGSTPTAASGRPMYPPWPPGTGTSIYSSGSAPPTAGVHATSVCLPGADADRHWNGSCAPTRQFTRLIGTYAPRSSGSGGSPRRRLTAT